VPSARIRSGSGESSADIPYIAAVIDTFLVMNGLGLLASLLVFAAMLMYLQTRQRSEIVSYGLSLRMGMRSSGHLLAIATEVGAMLVVASSASDAAAVQSHVKAAVRTNYSNPPAHGADIVRTILADADLRSRWELELAAMPDRIKANRPPLVPAPGPRG